MYKKVILVFLLLLALVAIYIYFGNKQKDSFIQRNEESINIKSDNYKEVIAKGCQSNADCKAEEFCTADLFGNGEGLCVATP